MPDYRVRFAVIIIREVDSPEHAEQTARNMVTWEDLPALVEKVEKVEDERSLREAVALGLRQAEAENPSFQESS